jgi:hypothetical protein
MLRSRDECRVCSNGELVFSTRGDTGDVIIECLECMTCYLDPRDVAHSPAVGTYAVTWSTLPATEQQVEALDIPYVVG